MPVAPPPPAATPYPNEPVPAASPASTATAAMALPDAAAGYRDEPSQERTMRLPEAPAEPDGNARRTGGDALAGAGDAVRRHAKRAADRFGAAPAEVRVAMVGAAVTVLSFLALPYADEVGTAARLGGRLWWRPIAAVVATVLLATTLRARGGAANATGATGTPTGTPAAAASRAGGTTDRLLAALVIAAVGATEAGLVGLFSGDANGTRIGYYGMLAGLVTVLAATVRAARRRCGAA